MAKSGRSPNVCVAVSRAVTFSQEEEEEEEKEEEEAKHFLHQAESTTLLPQPCPNWVNEVDIATLSSPLKLYQSTRKYGALDRDGRYERSLDLKFWKSKFSLATSVG